MAETGGTLVCGGQSVGKTVVCADGSVAACLCGPASPPPPPCTDERPCCDREGACTFGASAPPRLTARMDLSGRVILRRQMTRNLRRYAQENTVQVAFTGGQPLVLAPNAPIGAGACPVYEVNDHRRVDDPVDVATHPLSCAGGQLNITGRPTRILDATLRYSPGAGLLGYYGFGSGYLAAYTFDLVVSLGDAVTPGLRLKVFMYVKRFSRFEPAAVDMYVQAYKTAVAGSGGGGEQSYGFIRAAAATADNPCGTVVQFSIVKPFDEPPGQTDENGCLILGGTASNQCRICDSFDCALVGSVTIQEPAEPCLCDPKSVVPCECVSRFIPRCEPFTWNGPLGPEPASRYGPLLARISSTKTYESTGPGIVNIRQVISCSTSVMIYPPTQQGGEFPPSCDCGGYRFTSDVPYTVTTEDSLGTRVSHGVGAVGYEGSVSAVVDDISLSLGADLIAVSHDRVKLYDPQIPGVVFPPDGYTVVNAASKSFQFNRSQNEPHTDPFNPANDYLIHIDESTTVTILGFHECERGNPGGGGGGPPPAARAGAGAGETSKGGSGGGCCGRDVDM